MSVIDITNAASKDSKFATLSSDLLIYRVATEADCASLATLINSSYRGESSRQGWTNETELLSGQRTNTESVLDMITTDKYVFLVFFGEDDHILKGCIRLLHKPESMTACLSTFAVRPDLQARGYGKFILSVAENYAVNTWNAEYVELNVLIQKPELVAYYTRRGYIDTGHRQTYSIQQWKSMGALRYDLELCAMGKYLKKNETKASWLDWKNMFLFFDWSPPYT